MLNVVNGFYHPQKGAIRWRGHARARIKPYEAAARGHRANVCKTLRCSKRMTTLDNIMTGRSLQMKRNLLLASAADRSGARRGNRATASVCEEIINFLEIEHLRKTCASRRSLPYGLQKRVELGRGARDGAGTRRCSMSRWRA